MCAGQDRARAAVERLKNTELQQAGEGSRIQPGNTRVSKALRGADLADVTRHVRAHLRV